jgi:hypothetical protein
MNCTTRAKFGDFYRDNHKHVSPLVHCRRTGIPTIKLILIETQYSYTQIPDPMNEYIEAKQGKHPGYPDDCVD